MTYYKDEILINLTKEGNIAQFVSFAPNGKQRYSAIKYFDINHKFSSTKEAITTLLSKSEDKSVNIRSFVPDSPKSNKFIYGIKSCEEVLYLLQILRSEGKYVIVNETIDIHDGGVSGVIMHNIIEFSPDNTPRCVEQDGICSLSYNMGKNILKNIYDIDLTDLPSNLGKRIEFSIHPKLRGHMGSKIILWEIEEVEKKEYDYNLIWPNNFSKLLGDKTFGLLVANSLSFLQVPYSTVISRRIAPFNFGHYPHFLSEVWIRTCPIIQTPGKYITHQGWIDPFKLMQNEDPTGEYIASILIQSGIIAKYSGACITGLNGPIVEGKEGYGDDFMIGKIKSSLPDEIIWKVLNAYDNINDYIGSARFEWVVDISDKIWIMQLYIGKSESSGIIIHPNHNNVKYYEIFNSFDGIEKLREMVKDAKINNYGIKVCGNVGLTSHIGDILRKEKIPSVLAQ